MWTSYSNVGRLATSVLSLCLAIALVTQATARERWTPAQAWSWYGDQPMLYGANYVMTYAVSPTEMWQADTSTPGANTFDLAAIENELDIARDTGHNTLRTTLSYEVWRADRTGFMNRLEQFINASDERGIRPSFIFWDDVNHTAQQWVTTREPYLGVQEDPVPGVHNSQWTGTGRMAVLNNPGNWELPPTDPSSGSGVRDYVQDVVGAYANDERVLMWNIYNEPGNGSLSSALIRASAEWARELNPIQPLSFDVWGGSPDGVAWAESDVISYHNYSGPQSTMTGVQNMLNNSGRPVFITEWMARTFGSTIPDIFPELMDRGVASYNWGLVNGDQQTHWPWGSPAQTETTEPPLWFHDLYRRDGTPYIESEIKMLQHYRMLDTLHRSADSRRVAIVNPSFEADDLGGVPDATLHRVFSGWDIVYEDGAWVGGTIVPDTWHFTEDVPHGTQAMFAVDIEIGQELTETLEADVYYVLEVAVGHRVGRDLPDYDFQLLAGGVELTPLTEAFSNPYEGSWTDASRIYRVDSGDPLLGQALEIRLKSTDYETFFDDVRLTAVDSLTQVGVTSDLNMDGVIDRQDWLLFTSNSQTDLSGLTPAGRFLSGDLDWDGDNDHNDFLIFKSDYIEANSAEAFAMLLRVPEPSGVSLAVAVLACLFRRRCL